jgi:hypothetical protein
MIKIVGLTTILALSLFSFSSNSVVANANTNTKNQSVIDQLKVKREIPNSDLSTKLDMSSKVKTIPSFKKQAADDYLLEIEPNDFIYSANYLPLDIMTFGSFQTNEDVDYYEVTVPQSGTLLLGGITDYPSISLAIGLFDEYDQFIEPFYEDYTDIGTYFAYQLPPGTYYAAAIDYYGLPSDMDEVYGIQVGMLDTTPPKKPTINTIDDNDKLITGSAEAQSKIYVFRGSSLIKNGYADSNGKYSIPIPVQKAGTFLTVFSEDAAENVSISSSIKVIDKTAPGVPTVHPVDDNDTSVKGKAEANSTVTVKNGTNVVGSVKANQKGEFNISIKAVSAKTVLKVTAKDTAGNTSAEKKVTVLDKTPPKITKINEVDNNDQYVKGKAEANSTITVKVGSKVLGTATTSSKGDFSVKIKAQKTDNTISLYAKDAAGNTSKAYNHKVKKAK